MELVVDASALFAAIIGQGLTQDLFFEDKLKLVASPYLILEFEKNKGKLSDICGKPETEIIEIFELLKERIKFAPVYILSEELKSKAQFIAPHSKDAPYFALALHLGCAIWSREAAFKKQSEVKVYSTPELVDMFLK